MHAQPRRGVVIAHAPKLRALLQARCKRARLQCALLAARARAARATCVDPASLRAGPPPPPLPRAQGVSEVSAATAAASLTSALPRPLAARRSLMSRLLLRRGALPAWRRRAPSRSMASFAEMYRNSIHSAPVQPGDVLHGHVVGASRPRSSTSRFYIVDFGLKAEAPFTSREIPGSSAVGDPVTMPLLAVEDDFDEPVFDFDRRANLPALVATRKRMLLTAASSRSAIVYGRFVNFKRSGAGVKVLGTDAFVPRHHVVALDRPILGTYAPFYILNLATEKRSPDSTSVNINTVMSSYGGFLFCMADLVGRDSAWQQSGGGSMKERQAYLRLLTRLLQQKNAAVRRIFPRNVTDASYNRRRNKRGYRRKLPPVEDTAWLDDLSRGDWASSAFSKKPGTSSNWQKQRISMQKRTPSHDANEH
ncbi:hypothetical protein FGB62_11g014 [Gracilaria domingensis]|nr:hypothetical protein FGB62_11g014 [Gracilaria domingensis]